jgi:hypothetical protein
MKVTNAAVAAVAGRSTAVFRSCSGARQNERGAACTLEAHVCRAGYRGIIALLGRVESTLWIIDSHSPLNYPPSVRRLLKNHEKVILP